MPRMASWLAMFLYVTVLVAGLYSAIAGLCPADLRTAGFAGTLVLLIALEAMRRGPAGPMLALRCGLYVVVALLDCSGMGRALLLLIPFIGYFALGRRAGYALGALCLAGVVGTLSTSGWDTEAVSDLLMFVIGLVFAIAMAAVAQRHAEQAAALATAAERNRLARDIHDNVGHHLTVISVQLEKSAAFRNIDPAAADQALTDARESARLALEDVRRSVGTLRTHGQFSLAAALSALVGRFGTAVSLEIRGDESALDGVALPVLYHAAQESLTNAHRHACADRVSVEVELGRREARLIVEDDGKGFESQVEGFGVRGMRERLELVGGSLRIDSVPGEGTRVTATVPGPS
ncbi:sensor histidine kinase [Actinomadura rudentiformis]|uniref:histidine kinase n=1 Tax=Actinomadura rudentiformis TaxID=359158 RepID=A0A6H9YN89_9ACTN|nr:sensor histidine kinase [Actinomadura rudentiformis]KAB2342089.1 sensor histidine kinase [Actinomadura rudentiformis]